MSKHDLTSLGDLSNTRVLLLEGFARQVMPLMRALHDLGCHVTTYNMSRLDLGYASRYPDMKMLGFWDRDNMQESLNALRDVLKNSQFDVVIPLTDFSATILSQNKEDLSNYAALAVNDWDVFEQASDKYKTMLTCMDNNIPCPNTLRYAESVESILESGIEYPFVVKPRTGYGAIGLHRIDSEKKLQQIFPNLIKQYRELIIQEYIPQTDIQLQAQFFLDKEGAVKSACVFDKIRWYPIDGGSFCCGATVNRPDVTQTCTKLLNAIGWQGYADIDLIQDPRDGVAKILEINPRVTASVKICFVAGVDFARQILELATGQEVTSYKDYKLGCKLRYMHTDILWFLQSPNRFRIRPSWFDFTNTTDEIFSISDPWPWFTYSVQALTRIISELRKRKR